MAVIKFCGVVHEEKMAVIDWDERKMAVINLITAIFSSCQNEEKMAVIKKGKKTQVLYVIVQINLFIEKNEKTLYSMQDKKEWVFTLKNAQVNLWFLLVFEHERKPCLFARLFLITAIFRSCVFNYSHFSLVLTRAKNGCN